MKRSTLRIIILCWILTIQTFCSITSFASAGDTIKPLPQINKEFLIIVHWVYDKDSTPYDKSAIEFAVQGASAAFKPIGASFRICEYRDIYNFTYDTLTYKYDPELMVQYHVPNRINMFFVSTFPDKEKACGYASRGGIDVNTSYSEIVIKKGDCANTTTITHELGHYFSLLHTFETQYGDEYVNGSNCQTAGDGICDTPADPFIFGSEPSEYVNKCVFFDTSKDANGNYYNPDVSNIMSYYGCYCSPLKFTNGQYEKMANYYLNHLGVW